MQVFLQLHRAMPLMMTVSPHCSWFA